MQKVWTYHDLKRTPDDGRRYEIFDGELVVTPSPGPPHQFAVVELTVLFHDLLRDVAIAIVSPVDVVLSWTRVVIPDVVVVRRQRSAIITDRAVEGAPDLVVEVLSPKSSRRDRYRKARLYARVGIPEYWIVDPRAKTVEVYALGDRGYCLDCEYTERDCVRSVTFDLEVDVATIFPAITR